MINLEKEMAKKAAKDWERQHEVTRYLNNAYAPLRNVLCDPEHLSEMEQGHRSHQDRFRSHKMHSPVRPKEQTRIFLGSLGARVPPPYDYEWTYRDPDPGDVGVGANGTTGELGFNIDSFGQDDYNSSGGTAVGIYFRPVTETGRLAIWSDPSFFESWYDYAYFSSSHSDGFIGLYVGSYDDNGQFTGAVVNQQQTLWNDDSHLGSSGNHEDTNSGYSLSANCWVDSGHQYIIWVWAGGRAAADQVFGGASAGSALTVTVPSITWELT
jgi:hypothetical protein